MVKRKATPAQLRALAKGRAKLKARRRKNPNISAVRKFVRTKKKYTEREAWKHIRRQHGYPPTLKAKKSHTRTHWVFYVSPKRNPGPPTRGAVMSTDLPGMTRATGQRRATQQKIARKTIARYPKPKGQGGFRTNPPHYVIKGGKGYFDGAGWSTTKKGAAQYLSKTKASTVGQKIANATNKQVSVVAI